MGFRTTKKSAFGVNDAGKFISFFRSKLIGKGSNPPKDRGIQATGGTIVEYVDGGFFWRAHVFENSGQFVVEGIPGAFGTDIEYLVVAGGGGGGEPSYGGYGPLCPAPGYGGNNSGGGGGAGGIRTNSPSFNATLSDGNTFNVSVTSYPVIVGSGGAAGNYPARAGDGSNSIFNEPGSEGTTKITAYGGGGGGGKTATFDPGSFPNGPKMSGGYPGGSGGGGAAKCHAGGSGNVITGTTTPTITQGSTGGSSPPSVAAGGGSVLPTGAIVSSFSGTSVTYSGGGPAGPGGGGGFGVGGGAYGPSSTQGLVPTSIGSKGVVVVRYKISE